MGARLRILENEAPSETNESQDAGSKMRVRNMLDAKKSIVDVYGKKSEPGEVKFQAARSQFHTAPFQNVPFVDDGGW